MHTPSHTLGISLILWRINSKFLKLETSGNSNSGKQRSVLFMIICEQKITFLIKYINYYFIILHHFKTSVDKGGL